MDLPAEVMQVSMRVNQRYFALRDAEGQAAPYFAFVANVPGSDGGAAIVAGNERVLRARFSDARHFWDQDRKVTLESRVAALDGVTFHAKLGSQGQRVKRIAALAEQIAPRIGADPAQAARAGLLCKADLTSGMVGEFPELQGVMGGYYASDDGEDRKVAAAIRQHYQPKGPADAVPEGTIACAVALADKLDQLVAFFAIGEQPTGSGDPYALRRAALGVIRVLRERQLRLQLYLPLRSAIDALAKDGVEISLPRTGASRRSIHSIAGDVMVFIIERLRVLVLDEGTRHDVLNAAYHTQDHRTPIRVDAEGVCQLLLNESYNAEDDLLRLLARTDSVAALLGTEDGANLLAAYKRAANILSIENKRDGRHTGPVDPMRLEAPDEVVLAATLDAIEPLVSNALDSENFTAAMTALARLRPPLDAFFAHVIVNDTARPDLRLNRLALLHRLRAAMDQVADFSRIEG
jgi:glycyl-tRNA synthetase beta chain